MRHALKAASVALTIATVAGCGSSVDKSVADAQRQAPAAVKDALLVASIKTRIAAADVNSTTSVGVRVHAAHVVLVGRVRTTAEREKIEAAARAVDGIVALEDRIGIDPAARGVGESTADFALEARVATALAAQTGVNALHVRARARDGAVTLEGTVPTAAIKATMLATARTVSGIRSLADRIRVTQE